VAGLGCLDRDLRGFQVTDFAYHDDVRILAQERPQGRRECEAHLVINVDLVDAGQIDFCRIFGCRDVRARLVEEVQAGVEGHGLATAGGACHQYHPVRAADRGQQGFPLFRFVAQRIDVQQGGAGIEYPQHDLFAMQRRQRADPEINGAALRQDQFHPSVLGQALLGDVQARYDLDTGSDLLLDDQRRLGDLAQNPIDPEADSVVLFIGLEVNVRCALGNGVVKYLLDELHHWCVIDFSGGGVGGRFRRRFLVELHAEIVVHQILEGGFRLFDQFADDGGQFVGLDHYRVDGHARLEADFVKGSQIGGVGQRHGEPVAPAHQCQHLVVGHHPLVDRVPRKVLVGIGLGGIAVVIVWIAGSGSSYAEYILRMMPGWRRFVKTGGRFGRAC